MFQGYVSLEGTFTGTLMIVDASSTPVNADALPTYRVYGPNGFIEDGTAAELNSGNITNATNATPIVITSSTHGLTTGSYIKVENVSGNTAANGTFVITRVDANTFSLDGSTGNGSYTVGGDWNAAGLYKVTITALGVDGYESGEIYQVHMLYNVSAVQKSQILSFQVN
jgi:hypothetical protein